MIIHCDNGATSLITFEGERIQLSDNNTARVSKDVGERMAKQYEAITIKSKETKQDGDDE